MKTTKLFTAFLTILIAFIFSSCNSMINPFGGENAIELFPIMQNRKMGYINRSGEVVIQPQFDYALPFTEGLAVACIYGNSRKCGYIDETGKFVISPQFGDALRFSEGLAAVMIENKFGYIDKTGKYIINPQFSSGPGRINPFSTFSGGLGLVRVADKFGYIDKSGKISINPQFENAMPFFDGLAAVRIGDKWGYIDTEGKISINPQFEDAQPFINDLSAVKVGKQYGYIDKTGKIVINPQFYYALPFSDDGLAAVILNEKKLGFISKDGKYIISPQFSSPKIFGFINEAFLITSDLGKLSFSEGLAPVRISDKDEFTGYIDKTGKIVINSQFFEASPFYGGLAVGIFGSDSGGMAWIDKGGKIVWRENKETSKNSSNSSQTNANVWDANSNNMNSSVDQDDMNSNVYVTNENMESNSGTSSNQRTGRLVSDANLRSEPNKDSASVGIQFKDAKITILDETSYERDGVVSTWYKVHVTEYGCSNDTSLGCGKNSPNDNDTGWINAKIVLLN